MTNIQNVLSEDKNHLKVSEVRQQKIDLELSSLKNDVQSLENEIKFLESQDNMQTRDNLGNEIIALNQKISPIETQLRTLQSKIETIIKISLDNVSTQYEKILEEISTIKKEIEESIEKKIRLKEEIKELETEKERLSHFLLNTNTERKNYSFRIDELDKQIQKLEYEYEKDDKILEELRFKLHTFKLQMNSQLEKLNNMGYEKPVDTIFVKIDDVKVSLCQMKLELDSIGAVNQLAKNQYEDQIQRYKHLSIRMNELEKERMTIIDFIEEIDKKKQNAFMGAFNRTNERIDKYFSKLTGGGNAALQLQNPDNPLSAGVDMVVQFVGKPPILVNGASSGERSVAAVAFLFSLQEFTPASFYLMDEIDAHLDAFHVERLGELLAQEANRSQFLVVTLKPEMVSKASRIYGVYQRESISHVISTAFKEAV
jgi:chromosome segregation protein